MNLYLRYFDREILVNTVDEAIAFLSEIDEIGMNHMLEADIRDAVLRLNEERYGWYEGTLDFKRVTLMPGTGKFQYRDTHFVACCKAYSGQDCYNRIVDHLSQRVDSRSQFPSSKGKNFKFIYLGDCKQLEV